MLSLNNVTLRRGARTLLENVSFTLYGGWRTGVVGRNGTGKSSLFALIQGQLTADKGDCALQRNLVIASVAQETPALPDAAIEFVLDGDEELRQLERDLLKAEAAEDVQRIVNIHDRLNTIGGYAARARAGKLLHGLGFDSEAQQRAVADFSGGWRMRLNLARALMRRSDLLLLDEPTNHLDLDAVIWLQDFLQTEVRTLLLISHDREFLDAVTSHTLHLEQQGATLYTGNYSQFERTRAERIALQTAAFEKQQRQVAHLHSFIERFKAKASKARQAQSRIKQLERMELVAPAHFDSEFSFEFREPERIASPLLKLDGVRAGYGERVILSQLRVSLEPGDRIGLLGPNGAGKSTLIQTLAGTLTPLAGEMHRDPYLKVGYFAQHQVDQLDMKASPILHLRRISPQVPEQTFRDYLGSFNFRGDRAFEAVGPFSGGEKARLALALVVWQRPSLLLLDEPTNHLDLDMRHALETALQLFSGAVVLITHDRHLVSSTCDELWLVADGRCVPFDGDLDDYARWLKTRGVRSEAPVRSSEAAPKAPPPEATLRALRERIKKAEARIARVQTRLAEIEQALADPAVYDASRKAEREKLLRQQREHQAELDRAEADWLGGAEELEAAQAG